MTDYVLSGFPNPPEGKRLMDGIYKLTQEKMNEKPMWISDNGYYLFQDPSDGLWALSATVVPGQCTAYSRVNNLDFPCGTDWVVSRKYLEIGTGFEPIEDPIVQVIPDEKPRKLTITGLPQMEGKHIMNGIYYLKGIKARHDYYVSDMGMWLYVDPSDGYWAIADNFKEKSCLAYTSANRNADYPSETNWVVSKRYLELGRGFEEIPDISIVLENRNKDYVEVTGFEYDNVNGIYEPGELFHGYRTWCLNKKYYLYQDPSDGFWAIATQPGENACLAYSKHDKNANFPSSEDWVITRRVFDPDTRGFVAVGSPISIQLISHYVPIRENTSRVANTGVARLADGISQHCQALDESLLQGEPGISVTDFVKSLPPYDYPPASVQHLLEEAEKFLKIKKIEGMNGMDEEDVRVLFVYSFELVEMELNVPTSTSCPNQIYYHMCRCMRDGDLSFWRPLVMHLRRALVNMKKPKEIENRVVYRGVGVKFDINLYKPGTQVIWPAFSSSSIEKEVANKFINRCTSGSDSVGTLFVLHGKSCRPISTFSKFPEEEEYLFPPNCTFVVTGITTGEMASVLGCQLVQMKEVEQKDEDLDNLLKVADLDEYTPTLKKVGIKSIAQLENMSSAKFLEFLRQLKEETAEKTAKLTQL